MRPAILLVTAFAALTGCQSEERRCEHARDAFLALMEERSKEAIDASEPGARESLTAESSAELARARTRFVGLCKALPKEGTACIARIDELVATDREFRNEMRKCDGDEACRDVAKAKAEKRGDGCMEVLNPMAEKLWEP